jgi:hypothetical protein
LKNSCLHHMGSSYRGKEKGRVSYLIAVVGLCVVFTISMIKGGEVAA